MHRPVKARFALFQHKLEAGTGVGAVVAVGPAVGPVVEPVQFGESATLQIPFHAAKPSGVTVSAFMSETLYDSHPFICEVAEPAGGVHVSVALSYVQSPMHCPFKARFG